MPAPLATEMACEDGVKGICDCMLTLDLHINEEDAHDHTHGVHVLRELGAHLREAASQYDSPLAR